MQIRHLCFVISIFISDNYFNTKMQTGITTNQIARQVISEVAKNGNFFAQQSRDQLIMIKFAMESEVLEEKDPAKKAKMKLYARQAQEMSDYKKNKAKESIERVSLIQSIKQGAKDVNNTQKIVMAIVVLFTGLLAYSQNNEREGYFTITVIVCFFVCLGTFRAIIAYNCFCRRNTEQKEDTEINEDERILNFSPYKQSLQLATTDSLQSLSKCKCRIFVFNPTVIPQLGDSHDTHPLTRQFTAVTMLIDDIRQAQTFLSIRSNSLPS